MDTLNIMSPIIEQLRIQLEGRKTGSNVLAIYSRDFNDNVVSGQFTDFTETGSLEFNNSTLTSTDTTIQISGNINIWRQTNISAILVIKEIADLLQFSLRGVMPAGWRLPHSFAGLSTDYFNNLLLSDSKLIATSYNHTEVSEVLQKGLNLYSSCELKGSLQSLQVLTPSLSSCIITGMIQVQDETHCTATLEATLSQPIVLELPAPKLSIQTGNDVNHPDVAITAGFQQNGYRFQANIHPPADTILDRLETRLRTAMEQNNLLFQAADMGPKNEVLFKESVWTSTLQIKNTTLIRVNGTTLRITGTADVYQLGAQQPLNLVISEGDDSQLAFELQAVLAPVGSWQWGQSISGTSSTFFSKIAWKEVWFIASSTPLSYQIADKPFNLKKGLNFIGKPDLTHGALKILKTLQTSFDAMYLCGLVQKVENTFAIEIGAEYLTPINLNLAGLEQVTLNAPGKLLLSCKQTNQQEKPDSQAVFNGIASTGSNSFNATLSIPVETSDVEWELRTVQTSLQTANLDSLLELTKAPAIKNNVPPVLLQLPGMVVTDWNTVFIPGIEQRNVTNWTTTLQHADGSSVAWDIIPTQLSISNLHLQIAVANYAASQQNYSTALGWTIAGRVQIGRAAVEVKITTAAQNWLLQIVPKADEALPNLDDLANLSWKDGSHKGNEFLNILPAGLVESTPNYPIKLEEISAGFNPFTPALSFTSFKLRQNREWQIIPNDILTLKDWYIHLKLDITHNYTLTGQLNGLVRLGPENDIIASFNVDINIKKKRTDINISLEEDTEIRLESLGKLLGITQTVHDRGLPMGLDALGSLTIDQLNLNLTPGNANPLNLFHFNLYGAKKWVIVKDWLEIDNIRAGLTLQSGSEKYLSKGYISGMLVIAGIPIWVIAGKENFTDAWVLKLATRDDIKLPGLQALAQWMLPATMLEYIPEAFMPFKKGFLVKELDICFDLSNSKLNHIAFALRNRSAWEAIKGYIALDNTSIKARVEVTADPSGLKNTKLAVAITADLILGDEAVCIHFDANYNSDIKPHWTFSGTLKKPVRLTDLLTSIKLGSRFHLPTYTWLPEVIIQTAETTLQPEIRKFSFSGTVSATMNWDIPFSQNLKLNMIGLKAVAAFKDEKDKTPVEPNFFKAELSGYLDFNTLKATLTMALGSEGNDTVFTASLTASETSEFKIESFTNRVADEDGPDTWTTLRPSEMEGISFETIFTYYNYSQAKWLIYGKIKGLGNAALLTQTYSSDKENKEEQKRGYLFSFSVDKDFKFSTLFPALQPIDNILRIQAASITINSFDTGTIPEVKAALNNTIEAASALHHIDNPIVTAKGLQPTEALEKGTHLYAALDFEGNLFSRFLQLKKNGQSPDVAVYARFNTEATKTVFKATFAPFSIWDTIEFKADENGQGISMQYKPENKGEFNLKGIIALNLFSKEYAFKGNLTVNEQQTQFSAATVDDSLQVFGGLIPARIFTLHQLSLDVNYYFKTAERNEKLLTLSVAGKARLLAADFSAKLMLVNASPVFVEIALTEDFAISRLLGAIVDNEDRWKDSFFDIVFLKDKTRLYYFDEIAYTAQHPGKENVSATALLADVINGYHLQSQIKLTFIEQFTVDLRLDIEKGKGIKASAGLINPVNIFILQLAGTEMADKKYIGGPELEIDTTLGPEKQSFCFVTGINFLQTSCGAVKAGILKDGNTNTTKLIAEFTLPMSSFNEAIPQAFKGENKHNEYQYAPLEDFKLIITYSKSEGFKVVGWKNIDFICGLIDIAATLKRILEKMPKGGCSEIANWTIDQLVSSGFSVSPGIGMRADNSGLRFNLEGTYTLYFIGKPLASIPIRDLTGFDIPNNLSLQKLPENLKNILMDAAEGILKGLINNYQEWAKIAGILFAKQAAQVGIDMACRGLFTEGVKDAVVAAMAEAGEAAAIAAAAPGGAATAESIIAAAGAAAAAVFANPGKGGGGATEPGKTGGSTAPAAPVMTGLTYKEQNSKSALFVSWQRTAGLTSRCSLIHVDNNGREIQLRTIDTNDQECSFEIDIAMINGGKYKAKVQTVNDKGTSDWKVLEIPKSVNPTHIQTQIGKDGAIKVSWDENKETVFEVALYHQETLQLLPAVVVTGKNQYEFDSKPLAAGTYTGKVRAIDRTAHKVPSILVSQQPGTEGITKLKEPLNPQWSITDGQVIIQWNLDGIPAESRFKILLGNDPQSPLQIEETADRRLAIPVSRMPEGNYKLWIQTWNNPNTIPSNFAGAESALTKLIAPAEVRISVKDANTIQTDWSNKNLPDQTAYFYVELVDSTNRIIDHNQTVNGLSTTLDFPITSWPEDDRSGMLSARVTAIAKPAVMYSNASVSATGIGHLDAPEPRITLIHGEDFNYRPKIVLNWENVMDNNGYEVILSLTYVTDKSLPRLQLPQGRIYTLEKNINTLEIDSQHNETFSWPWISGQAALRAIPNPLNNKVGSKHKSVALLRLDAPILRSHIDRNLNKIFISWNKIEQAIGYQGRINNEIIRFNENITNHVIEINENMISFQFELATLSAAQAIFCSRISNMSFGRLPRPTATVEVIREHQNIVISWNNIPGNNGYKVKSTADAKSGWDLTIDTTELIIPYDDQFAKDVPIHYEIIACGGEEQTLNSLPVFITIERVPPVENIKLERFGWSVDPNMRFHEGINAEWQLPANIQYATEFNVQLTDTSTNNVLYNQTKADMHWKRWEPGENNGPFLLEITARALSGLLLDSEKVLTLISRIAPIESIEQSEDKTQITWKEVEGSQGYTWELRDSHTQQIVEKGYVQKNFSHRTEEDICSITLKRVRAEEAGNYYVLYVQTSTPDVNRLSSVFKSFSDISRPVIEAIVPARPMWPKIEKKDADIIAVWESAEVNVDYELQLIEEKTLTILGDPIAYLFPAPHYYVKGKSALINTRQNYMFPMAISLQVRAVTPSFINVLKNGDGSRGLGGWENLTRTRTADTAWAIEHQAASCFATDSDTNFVSSHIKLEKSQTIDLLKAGLTAEQLDKNPEIQVSEWVFARFDCPAVYQLYVELRDAQQNVIAIFDSKELRPEQNRWTEVYHSFDKYEGKVRFVYYKHSAKDTKTWRGYYGCKITGGQVKVKITDHVNTSEWSEFSNIMWLQM